MTTRVPLRLSIVNDYEIVVAGLNGMLAPYAERVQVIEVAAGTTGGRGADLVLFDSFARPVNARIRMEEIARPGTPVVVYTWDTRPEIRQRAVAWGAAACISKTVSAAELVDVLEAVRRGSAHGVLPVGTQSRRGRGTGRTWPGQLVGLTEREAEVVALIAAGHSNAEIAEMLHVSINSVKTYIRSAYRKAGVTRRSQAVLWAIDHGFGGDLVRHRGADVPDAVPSRVR